MDSLNKSFSLGNNDALYFKAKYKIERTFFAGKKTCKPLKDFLNIANPSSRFFENATELFSKKCRNFYN